MNVLVTGASGFVGGAVARRLVSDGEVTRAAVRSPFPRPLPGVEEVRVGDFHASTDWRGAVNGMQVVVHAAARVHVMRDATADPLAEYRRVNVAGSLALARSAAAAGVRRFVFISSVKVNGEGTRPGRPFAADDAPAPVDPYGVSKLEAEQGLLALARDTGLEVVTVRPVLVYGPGVRGNFLTMMRWLHKGTPLPLGAVRNQRSLVALENLVDLIATCVRHPDGAGQVFMAADGEDLSTIALLRRTAAAMGRPARLIPVPPVLLRGAARLLGRADMAERLCGSLQVDIGKTRRLLAWTPPMSVEESLRQTAQYFLAQQAGKPAVPPA